MSDSAARDERSAPFFDAAERGVLALQTCGACGVHLQPLRSRCPACGSADVRWTESRGRGVVWSHGRQHRSSQPEHAGKLPLTLLLVQLDEGVRFASRLALGSDARPRVGDRVAVVFERLEDGTPVPVFVPA